MLAAPNGREALEIISEQTEVFVVNLNIPEIDGFGCLKVLPKDRPHIPVIVLTATDSADDAVKAMKLGAFDYIPKPFDPNELITVPFASV